MNPNEKRPACMVLLLCLLIVQAIGALVGGIALVLSPSGEIMKMSSSMLKGCPFDTFLIPGIILLVVLGIFPAFIAWALIARPYWRWPDAVNVYRGIHWAWTFSLYLGIMLAIWIFVEIMFIPFDILQTIFGMVGMAIIIATLLPGNMAYFGWIRKNNLNQQI
ncbi:MAG: hypothetical protein WCK92_14355 [Bacteroidota bacterium]